jgi:hypothetical protein
LRLKRETDASNPGQQSEQPHSLPVQTHSIANQMNLSHPSRVTIEIRGCPLGRWAWSSRWQ